MQQRFKCGVMSWTRPIIWILFWLHWCGETLGVQNEMQSTTHPHLKDHSDTLQYDISSLQLVLPSVPLKEDFLPVADVTVRSILSSKTPLLTAKGSLLHLFVSNMTAQKMNPSFCSTLRPPLTQEASLDHIYFTYLAVYSSSCRVEWWDSVLPSFMNYVKKLSQHPITTLDHVQDLYGTSTVLKTLDHQIHSLLTLPPWAGIYKAVAILKMNAKEHHWMTEEEQFIQHLHTTLKSALLSTTTTYDSSLLLEILDTYFSLARMKDSNLHTAELNDMIQALHVWWSTNPTLTHSNRLFSTLHMLSIDTLIREVTHHADHAPFLSWIHKNVRFFLLSFDYMAEQKKEHTKHVDAVLFFLSLIHPSFLRTLLPLFPDHATFHLSIAQASLGVCATHDGQQDLSSSTPDNLTPCLQLLYCPLFPDSYLSQSTPQWFYSSKPQLSMIVYDETNHSMETISLNLGENLTFLPKPFAEKGSPRTLFPTCQTTGPYLWPALLPHRTFQGIVLHLSPPTDTSMSSSVVALPLHYSDEEDHFNINKIPPQKRFDYNVQVKDSPGNQIHTNIENISWDFTKNPVLSLIITLKDPQDNLLENYKSHMAKTLFRPTLHHAKLPQFLAVLVEGLAPEQLSHLSSSAQPASQQYTTKTTLSNTMLLPSYSITDEEVTYVVTVNVEQLAKDFHLVPMSVLRLTLLIVEEVSSSTIKQFIATLNLNGTHPTSFTWTHTTDIPVSSSSSPNLLYHTIHPSERFWYPKPLIHHQFPPTNKNAFYHSWVSAVFLLLVLVVFSFTFRVLPSLNLHIDWKTLTVLQKLFLIHLVVMSSLLLWYWTHLTFRYFLKFFCVSMTVTVLLNYIANPPFFFI